MKNRKKVIIGTIFSILLVVFFIYAVAIYMFNKDIAFVIARDEVTGERTLQEGDIYYHVGEADIFCPSIGISAECYPEDSIMITLGFTNRLFGEEEGHIGVWKDVYGHGTYQGIGTWFLERDGSLYYEDISDTRNIEQCEEAWGKYSDEIQMLIDGVDEKWDLFE